MPSEIRFHGRFKVVIVSTLLVFSSLLATCVHAQNETGEGAIEISWPLPGGVLAGSSDTIYFSPGKIDVTRWRVTVGASPLTSGIFDSGIQYLDSHPWKLELKGLPQNGKPVTVRFWQKGQGSWTFTDSIFITRSEGSGQVQAPDVESLPVVETKPVVETQPIVEAQPVTSVSPAKKMNTVTQTRGGPVPTALQAVHKNGQTFLTWSELGDAEYHVYRHTAPITSENFQQAELLTKKWGPLSADTSVNAHAHSSVPETYVITDLGAPLSVSQGLFVHTTAVDSNAFYAVTAVRDGKESISLSAGENSLTSAVAERVATTKPVLTLSLNSGKGRVYTQYMDYAKWNPTFNGYAYNYTIALPAGYRSSSAYPLLVAPHAYGEEFAIHEESQYGWQVIQMFPSDPGFLAGTVNSWWYGYAADHNYQTDGLIPTAGSIENFTQQRVMMAIESAVQDPELNIDTSLIHAYGHSMGASGSLSYGIHYGSVFAGIYGSEAMTNYKSSPKFQSELERLWGSQSSNLPIVNRGLYSDSIKKYDGTGVWDWMNHHKQLVDRSGDRMSYLMLAQGKADTIIDWPTQGEPMARVFNEAKVGYSARFHGGAGHSWLGFSAIVHSLFGLGYDDLFAWRYPRELSFPSIQYASGSGPLTPAESTTDQYNLDIEWATGHNWFDKEIVDKKGRYEISLRTTAGGEQRANITPRNTRQFKPAAGASCSWKTVNNNNRKTLAQGKVTADRNGLVTVDGVNIKGSVGTRVFIDCR